MTRLGGLLHLEDPIQGQPHPVKGSTKHSTMLGRQLHQEFWEGATLVPQALLLGCVVIGCPQRSLEGGTT